MDDSIVALLISIEDEDILILTHILLIRRNAYRSC